MILKEVFQNPTSENVEDLIKEIYLRIPKRSTPNAIFDSVFKTSWNERESKSRLKKNILAACDFLEFLRKEQNENFIKNVKSCIADLFPLLEDYFDEKDLKFRVLNTNTLSSLFFWDIVESLFYRDTFVSKTGTRDSYDLPVIYLMRLSLESRIHGFLGIDLIRVRGKSIQLAELIKFSSKMKSVIFDSRLNWDRIEKINNWLNHFMHRHIRPYPWSIHLAINELKPFFMNGEKIYNGKKSYSWFNSTSAYNRSELKEELISYLNEKYGNDVVIVWSHNPEIHFLK